MGVSEGKETWRNFSFGFYEEEEVLDSDVRHLLYLDPEECSFGIFPSKRILV